jgi:hypothetical protein
MEYLSLTSLQSRIATGEQFTAFDILAEIDISQNYEPIKALAVAMQICTKVEWNAAEKKERKRRAVVDRLGRYPSTALDFVELYAEGIMLKAGLNGLLEHTQPLSNGEFRVVGTDLVQQMRRVQLLNCDLGLPYSRATILDAVHEWSANVATTNRDRTMAAVAFDPSANFDWIGLCQKSFVIKEDRSAAYHASILQKFVYDVKRKSVGLPVTNPLMPVIVGPQRVGKSYFVEKFISPLAGYSVITNFTEITDTRNIELWNTPILFLDEMAKGTTSDVASIKHKISCPTVSGRIMGSNATTTIQNRSVMIGTNNHLLAQSISDPTGLTRFGEMIFKPSGADWGVIDSADYAAAWRSVDENGPDPILQHLAMLRSNQEASRQLSTVEEWLDAIKYDPQELRTIVGRHGDQVFRKEELWALYQNWRQAHGLAPRFTLEPQPFVMEMNRLCNMATDNNMIFMRHRTNQYWGWRYVGPSEDDIETMIAEEDVAEKAALKKVLGR